MKKLRKCAIFVTVLTMLCTQVSYVSALGVNRLIGQEGMTLVSNVVVGDEITLDNIVYKVTSLASSSTNGTVSVSDGSQANGNIIIPQSIEIDGNTYDVTMIAANAFKDNTHLTGIDLSQTLIKEIGNFGFFGCTALTNVQVPNSYTVYLNLGNRAFANCTALKKIEFQTVQISNKSQPFNGSGIQEISIITFKGSIPANAFSGLSSELKITFFNQVSKSSINAYMLGSTPNVTIVVSDAKSKDNITSVLGPTKATVVLMNENQEATVMVKSRSGDINGYATLADAFNAINSGEEGPYTVTLKSNLANYIVWPNGLVPQKETVIDFSNNNVALPETLTLQAPLTIKNVNNFSESPLCTLKAGEHAFVLDDGGSFGFKTIIGNDLTFIEKLPGSTSLGDPCQIVGYGHNAVVEFKNKGSTNYYYNFPTISQFEEVILNKAFFTATQEKIADTRTITVQNGGLEVSGEVEVSRLNGKGEIRFEDNSSLNVKDTIKGSWVLPAIDQDNNDIPLTLPTQYQASVKDKNGVEIQAKVNEAIVEVTGGSLQSQQYSSLASALEAIEDESNDETYTLTLLADATLTQSVLPKVSLTIDGKGHQLSTTQQNINIYHNFVLKNIGLDFKDTTLKYASDKNGERKISIEDTVTGELQAILDNSQSRYLDIQLNGSNLVIHKITGTTSTIHTKLTDLLINNYGTVENPVDLSGKVENLAATELHNSYLKVSGDSTYLGVIRTPSTNSQGALILTDDTQITSLSLWKNTAFELKIPSSKTLTLGKVAAGENIPITLIGEPQDGQAIIHLEKIPKTGAENYFVLKMLQKILFLFGIKVQETMLFMYTHLN